MSATAEAIAGADEVVELTDHPGAEAFAAATDTLDGWLALMVADDRLGATRPLEPPDVLDGEVRDHERLVVEQVGRAAMRPTSTAGWRAPRGPAPCAPTSTVWAR